MTTTSTQCIHGFSIEQCVSCRTCPHGQPSSSCVRCRASSATTKAATASISDQSSHEHAGYEIFYEPAVSGWRYRAPDASASHLSYRSAFLARKAVDARVGGTGDPDEPRSPAAKRARRKG